MFEFTPGRFVNPALITGAGIYEKEGQWHVAIDLDVKASEKNAVYRKGFTSFDDAKKYVATIPVGIPA